MTQAEIWAQAMEWAADLAETFARATDMEARKKIEPHVEIAVAKAMRTLATVYRGDASRVPLHIDDDKTPAVGTSVPPAARKDR